MKLFNFFKRKTILGIKITAVKGKDEIILWYQNVPYDRKIQIPIGYDLLVEPIYEKEAQDER